MRELGDAGLRRVAAVRVGQRDEVGETAGGLAHRARAVQPAFELGGAGEPGGQRGVEGGGVARRRDRHDLEAFAEELPRRLADGRVRRRAGELGARPRDPLSELEVARLGRGAQVAQHLRVAQVDGGWERGRDAEGGRGQQGGAPVLAPRPHGHRRRAVAVEEGLRRPQGIGVERGVGGEQAGQADGGGLRRRQGGAHAREQLRGVDAVASTRLTLLGRHVVASGGGPRAPGQRGDRLDQRSRLGQAADLRVPRRRAPEADLQPGWRREVVEHRRPDDVQRAGGDLAQAGLEARADHRHEIERLQPEIGEAEVERVGAVGRPHDPQADLLRRADQRGRPCVERRLGHGARRHRHRLPARRGAGRGGGKAEQDAMRERRAAPRRVDDLGPRRGLALAERRQGRRGALVIAPRELMDRLGDDQVAERVERVGDVVDRPQQPVAARVAGRRDHGRVEAASAQPEAAAIIVS